MSADDSTAGSATTEAVRQPTLGPLGWARWTWRNLTSMRTAPVSYTHLDVYKRQALQGAWAAYEKAGKPVVFVGIDTMEAPETGLAFLRAKGVTFPSINDQANQGAPVLALQGKAPATPTTLVLDRQGRVAARVLGPTSEVTVRALVDAVLAEA